MYLAWELGGDSHSFEYVERGFFSGTLRGYCFNWHLKQKVHDNINEFVKVSKIPTGIQVGVPTWKSSLEGTCHEGDWFVMVEVWTPQQPS